MYVFHVWNAAVTLTGRTISAISENDAARIFLGQQASASAPFGQHTGKPACRVQADDGTGKANPERPSTPFWHADPTELTVEELNASNDE
jgi:hypothetical protein